MKKDNLDDEKISKIRNDIDEEISEDLHFDFISDVTKEVLRLKQMESTCRDQRKKISEMFKNYKNGEYDFELLRRQIKRIDKNEY